MKSQNVCIDFFCEIGKWIIFTDCGKLVKSYISESDAFFDYASLRNGETTINQVRSA